MAVDIVVTTKLGKILHGWSEESKLAVLEKLDNTRKSGKAFIMNDEDEAGSSIIIPSDEISHMRVKHT